MADKADIETRFWQALRRDMTVMLGLASGDGHAQPMTAQFHDRADERGPIWFFSSSDVDLVHAVGSGAQAMLHFAAKDHDLFASVEGRLVPDNDRSRIEALWNPFIAAWFEGGKDDPKLRLLRFDADHAQIWLNENSLFAGVKILFGSDPKQDYKDKVAEVDLA